MDNVNGGRGNYLLIIIIISSNPCYRKSLLCSFLLPVLFIDTLKN